MAKNIKACLTSNTDDWKTPSKMYEFFINKCGFIDTFKYHDTENQFNKIYYNENIYMNPPFSKMKEVTKYIHELVANGNFIILLIPARTDTKYFHELLKLNPEITFIKGRLHYNDSKSAPFPSIILTFHKNRLLMKQTWIAREREAYN